MKNFSIILLPIFGTLIIFIGCNKDQFLSLKPEQSFTEVDIWGNIELAKKYVWNNYNVFGEDEGVISRWAISDNNYPIFYPGVTTYDQGSITPSSMGPFSGDWRSKYKYINNVNVFLEHIKDVKGDEAVKNRLTGEMIFIRAYCYSQLLDLFGGIPIITKAYNLNDNFEVKRDPYEKGIEWVVNQLDSALNLVPATVSADEWGRVTKGAVLALKSEVLLYAASELHSPDTAPNGPLYTYNKPDKWKDAADAAKAVIDLGIYSLVEVNNWQDYQQMFLHNTSEIIFARPLSPEYTNDVNINLILSPNGYGGWSGSTPTQDLVDDFQMKDGNSINTSVLYNSDPDLIYKNRELRFYADIVYQGANYRGRETEFYLPGGLDSRDGPTAWNYAVSGYTVRKHMDESFDFNKSNGSAPSIFYRLAGIYLNYAEAAYHLGNEEIAREYVNKIRNRVHLPDIQSSGEDLLKDIQHERRIELCFEGFGGYRRWSDLRRWMLAKEKLNVNQKGIEWKKVNSQGELSPNGKLVYNIINILDRKFTDNMYYTPIPLSEIQKSDIQQNEGY